MLRRVKNAPQRFSFDNLDGIKQYKRTFSPLITRKEERSLQAKLALEDKSISIVTDRFNNNKLYLDYDTNPFMNLKPKKHRNSNSFSHISYKNQEKKLRNRRESNANQDRTILDLMTDKTPAIAKPETQKRLNRFNKISKILVQSQKVSTKFIKDIEVKNKIENENKFKKYIYSENKEYVQIKKPIELGMTQEDKKIYQNYSVHDIFNIKEKNFFFHQGKKKINVFNVAKDQQTTKAAVEELNEKSFCHYGLIDILSAIKIPVFRQVSRLGRDIINKAGSGEKISEILETAQANIKQDNLSFCDIMSFASGRIWPKFLCQNLKDEGPQIHKNYQHSDTSSQILIQPGIIYKRNTQNNEQNFIGEDQQKKQVQQFSCIKQTQKQKQFQKDCLIMKQRIRNILKQKTQILKLKIQDQVTHQQQTKQIKTIFKQYINKKQNKDQKQIDKMVKKNKSKTDKIGCLYLKNLTNILQQKNQIYHIFNNHNKKYQ